MLNPLLREEIQVIDKYRGETRGIYDEIYSEDPTLAQLLYRHERYREILNDGATESKLVNVRWGGIVERDWTVKPASDDRTDIEAAEMVSAHLDELNLDDAWMGALHQELYGSGFQQVVWDSDGMGEVRPIKIRTEMREAFRFTREDETILNNHASHMGRAIRLISQGNWRGMLLPKRKWIPFTFRDARSDPNGNGLGRQLWWLAVVLKKEGVRQWVTWLDRYASPIPVAKIPPQLSDGDREQVEEFLEGLSQGQWGTFPEDVVLEFMQTHSVGSGGESYENFTRWVDDQISIAVLGQTLTSDVGDRGSYAASQTHGGILTRIQKFTSDTISATYNRTLIAWDVWLNYGDRAKPPTVYRNFEETENLKEVAERDKILFDLGYRRTEESFTETYGEGYTDDLQAQREQQREDAERQAAQPQQPDEDEQTEEVEGEPTEFAEPDDEDWVDRFARRSLQENAPIHQRQIEKFADLMEQVERLPLPDRQKYQLAQERIMQALPESDALTLAEQLQLANTALYLGGMWAVTREGK